MSIHDNDTARSLDNLMKDFQRDNGPLPGIANAAHFKNLILQFIDSIHREKFAFHIRDTRLHPARMDPESEIFDPLRAAVLRNRRGEYDEAWWLVFLATHFGRHPVDGWRLTRDVYGKLGQGGTWSWNNISNDPLAFQNWLAANQSILQGSDGISRRFNNHRKYESLDATSNNGTASVFASYVKWIAPPRSHSDLIQEQHRLVGQDPKAVFAALYKSMNGVRRFGRLGKFDFLAMLGKLGIAPVEPGSTFLKGATGPLAGARLLFSGSRETKISPTDLEEKLGVLGEKIGLSPQVLEDALCNWQKHPDKYKRFRG